MFVHLTLATYHEYSSYIFLATVTLLCKLQLLLQLLPLSVPFLLLKFWCADITHNSTLIAVEFHSTLLFSAFPFLYFLSLSCYSSSAHRFRAGSPPITPTAGLSRTLTPRFLSPTVRSEVPRVRSIHS